MTGRPAPSMRGLRAVRPAGRGELETGIVESQAVAHVKVSGTVSVRY
jgi:hypothetical protein